MLGLFLILVLLYLLLFHSLFNSYATNVPVAVNLCMVSEPQVDTVPLDEQEEEVNLLIITIPDPPAPASGPG